MPHFIGGRRDYREVFPQTRVNDSDGGRREAVLNILETGSLGAGPRTGSDAYAASRRHFVQHHNHSSDTRP